MPVPPAGWAYVLFCSPATKNNLEMRTLTTLYWRTVDGLDFTTMVIYPRKLQLGFGANRCESTREERAELSRVKNEDKYRKAKGEGEEKPAGLTMDLSFHDSSTVTCTPV